MLAHLRGEVDEFGRYEAAYQFVMTLLPRMLFKA